MTVTIRKRALRLVVGMTAVLVALAIFGAYLFGFERGARTDLGDQLRRSECRATLSEPVNAARDDGQVAFNFALPAAVTDDPDIVAALERATGEVGDDVFREQVLDLIRANVRYRAALEARGNVVARCKDGHP